jgi:hypothetical protein
VVEGKHHVQAVLDELAGLLDGDVERLADGEHVVVPDRLVDQLADVFVDSRPGDEVFRSGQGGVGVPVREPLHFREEVDHVHAEAVDSLLQPPRHHLVDVLANAGVSPVQVGLFRVEQVEVPRAALLVVAPGLPAEQRVPVVRPLVGVALAPDVVVVVRFHPVPGPLEPLVFVRGVVDDQVHDETDVAVVEPVSQRLPVVHGPVLLVDRPVVADVVAVVGPRGLVDGIEPDDVDAQVAEVIELLDDAGDVADAVAVRVVETLGVDLVDDGLSLPGAFTRHSPVVFRAPWPCTLGELPPAPVAVAAVHDRWAAVECAG